MKGGQDATALTRLLFNELPQSYPWALYTEPDNLVGSKPKMAPLPRASTNLANFTVQGAQGFLGAVPTRFYVENNNIKAVPYFEKTGNAEEEVAKRLQQHLTLFLW
jgi:hypothetical protein